MRRGYLQNSGGGLDAFELRFPPLPQTLLKAVELTHSDDDLQVDQVIAMVEHDPAVATRLLRVVNSAYYSTSKRINDLRRAVVLLGPYSVVSTVMSLGMSDMRSALDATTTAPCLNLIRHSIAAAFLAKHIVSHDPGADVSPQWAGEVFTAALLHDFGKLTLLYNVPEQGARFYAAPVDGGAAYLEAERAVFGFDHVEAGSFLAQRLDLPALLADVIRAHHDAERRDEASREVRHCTELVEAANKAANALGYTLNDAMDWEGCAADPVWERLIDRDVVRYASVEDLLGEVRRAAPALEAYVSAAA